MDDATTITRKVHFAVGARGQRSLRLGETPPQDTTIGPVPRVARLMALAIRFERLIQEGAVRDQAEIAELCHITRARVTQIMNLLHLAPDIQEAILFAHPVVKGRDPLTERSLRSVSACIDWGDQRAAWPAVQGKTDI